jgi:amidase
MNHDQKSGKRDRESSRRGFLKASLATGAASLLQQSQTLHARTTSDEFLPVDSSELDELSIADLQAYMQSGKYTARSVVEKYLARIDQIDRNGPALRAVIEANPDALSIADSLDRERKEKGQRGPLHGIPILLKDNIDTADRMATTAGSLALLGSSPSSDAFLVQQLRKAGAVILGKTNLSEWANIRSNRSTSGWSGSGGLTRNPYALDRNTSGSSSGSGVAVAANLCAVAVGTETDGSIVSPSSINGIVGIKPTVGLVSRTGIVPISHTQDTAGPMARSVSDAALLLSALVGVDPADKATIDSRGRYLTDYTRFLTRSGLRGKRIGIVRKYFGFHHGVDAVMGGVLEALKVEGAILVDPADIPSIGKLDADEFTVLLHELKADIKTYLEHRGHGGQVRSLKDIIEFNERNKEKEMPFFGQETFLKAEATDGLKSKKYLGALSRCQRLSRREGIDAVMEKYHLDALMSPTDSPAWLTDLVLNDHYIGGSSTAAAVAGYPSITVPAGVVFGLPVGVSFFGRAWSEQTLIAIAFAFEQATKARRPPHFLPTVNLGV